MLFRSVSDDGSVATPVYFNSPVFVNESTQYAVVVIPGANSPNYTMYTAVLGDEDLATGSKVTQQPAVGDLYVSSNQQLWTPVPNDDLKYTIYYAEFDKSDVGNLILKNENLESCDISDLKTNTFDVVRLSRKLTRLHKAHNHPKNTRLYITDIIPVESVPVRCIQVSDERHLFLCGKTMVPTHNTTTAAGYLLWYAMFHDDVTVLIAANKFKAASEIMMRIKYAYEEMSNTIRCGVVEYNVTSISFDNRSRIIATTTTPDKIGRAHV